jgi:hypothetical protein
LNKNFTFAIWSWLMVSVLLEVSISYYLASAPWVLRDGLIGIVAISAVVPMALSYLDLLGEHIAVKGLMLIGVFFSLDLILIWTASLVH